MLRSICAIGRNPFRIIELAALYVALVYSQIKVALTSLRDSEVYEADCSCKHG